MILPDGATLFLTVFVYSTLKMESGEIAIARTLLKRTTQIAMQECPLGCHVLTLEEEKVKLLDVKSKLLNNLSGGEINHE